jgi:hypothetical protein
MMLPVTERRPRRFIVLNLLCPGRLPHYIKKARIDIRAVAKSNILLKATFSWDNSEIVRFISSGEIFSH